MRRIYPAGYATGHAGTAVGIIFGLWCCVLAAVMLAAGGGFIQASPFIVTATVLLIGGPLSDHTRNRAARARIIVMEELMKCPSVTGRIVRTERFTRFLGKERPLGEYTRARHELDRFTVAYTDPETGEEREAVSEDYLRLSLIEKVEGRLRVGECYDTENAEVFISPDGRTWVELLYKNIDQ